MSIVELSETGTYKYCDPGPFKVGDIVRLKSGGPSLVVATPTRTDGLIRVEWFANDLLQRDCIDPQNLIHDREDGRQ